MQQLAAAVRAVSPRTHLGDRVRQLRIARGLTQTDLAGDRCSKEYVSPDRARQDAADGGDDRVARRPARSRHDASSRSASRRTSATASRARRRAPRRASRRTRNEEAVEALVEAQPALARRPGARARAPRAASPRRGRACTWATSVRRSRCSSARGRSPSRRSSPTSSAPTSSTGSAAAATSSTRSRRRSRFSARRIELLTRSGLPADRLRAHILEWRSRCYQRQRDFEAAREDVERALELAESLNDTPHGGPRLLPGVARRRADGPLGAGAHVRRARPGALPGGRRRGQHRQAPEQPRRPELPARQSRPGDRAPEGRVSRRARGRQRDRRRPTPSRRSRRCTSASARTSSPRNRRDGRSSCSATARTSSTRSATPSSCSAARCSSRAGSTRPATRSPLAEKNFSQMSSASHKAAAWVAQGDLAARPRRRTRRGRALPARGRGAPGLPVLEGR